VRDKHKTSQQIPVVVVVGSGVVVDVVVVGFAVLIKNNKKQNKIVHEK